MSEQEQVFSDLADSAFENNKDLAGIAGLTAEDAAVLSDETADEIRGMAEMPLPPRAKPEAHDSHGYGSSLDGYYFECKTCGVEQSGITGREYEQLLGAHPTGRRKASAEIARYADVAMYQRKPMDIEEGGVSRPRVTLMYQTLNPLRVMAAAAELYRGNVIHDPSEVSQELAMYWLKEMTKTVLGAPLEFIDFVFLFENVTRAFTHQLVRQRVGAVYIQESMRFSVVGDEFEVRVPPTLEGLNEDDPRRAFWDQAHRDLGRTYRSLINAGVPAEDARGMLPTNITTRIWYKTNLRGLAEHAGMRLCSQAQYEWKEVWDGILRAIMGFGPGQEAWQQRAIARLFKPVCYSTGKCEFNAESDRFCVIRDRVTAHHEKGEGPEHWNDIDPHEPLQQNAALLSPEMAQHLGRTR